MTAADIAKALNGIRTGRGFIVRCPVPSHGSGRGDRNPSLSISDSDDRLLVYCHAGCDAGDVLDELRKRHLLSDTLWRLNPPRSISAKSKPPAFPLPDDDAQRRVAFAMRLWAESRPLNGTIGVAYFTIHRGLDIDRLGDLSHCLRWHADKQMIVALMTGTATNTPVGIHRTFLNKDGTKRERKMLGRQGVVMLTPSEDVTHGLGICEGLEDGMAIVLSGWRPVWVATSAGAIRSFPVLSGIEALTIFADPDQIGQNASLDCAERWQAHNREAMISEPPKGSADG